MRRKIRSNDNDNDAYSLLDVLSKNVSRTGRFKGGCGFVCDLFVCAYVDDTLTLSSFLSYDMQSCPSILDGYRENLVTYIYV